MKRCSFLKKAISTVITFAMLITALALPTEAAASIESAEKAVKAINAGWNLGNCLDSCG